MIRDWCQGVKEECILVEKLSKIWRQVKYKGSVLTCQTFGNTREFWLAEFTIKSCISSFKHSR